MTREEFDEGLNQETILGLTSDRTKMLALYQLATGYRRPDLAQIIGGVADAIKLAITQVEGIGRTDGMAS